MASDLSKLESADAKADTFLGKLIALLQKAMASRWTPFILMGVILAFVVALGIILI